MLASFVKNPSRFFILLFGLGFNMDIIAGNIGPERAIETLKVQRAQHYYFVISYKGSISSEVVAQRIPNTAIKLELLHGYAAKIEVREAFAIAEQEDIAWVWYLHPSQAQGTINAIQGIDYTVKTMPLPNLANLSVGPPSDFYQLEADTNEPMTRALDAAADKGLVSIVAIGNQGNTAPGYVNPWSTSNKVISVGAWDHTTNAVWSRSSVAKKEFSSAWPDVVAPGVDVIGPQTSTKEKSPSQKKYDESNERFVELIEKEKWDLYTLKSGTSQAAAVVTNASAQLLRYLNGFIKEHGSKPGDQLFSLETGPERISSYDTIAERLTGRAKPTDSGGMIYEYWLDAPWKLIKQILIDTASPIAGAEPWEAGAGLVDPEFIREQFGQYGTDPASIMAVKVQ